MSKGIIGMIQTKLSLIQIQKSEVIAVLESYVDKQTKAAAAAVKKDGKNVDKLKKINSNLECALNLLFSTYGHFDSCTEESTQARAASAIERITMSSTTKSQAADTLSPIAIVFNRRLEKLEVNVLAQDEQNQNLRSATEDQQQKFLACDLQLKTLKESLEDLERRHASEISALKLQRNDLEDNLATTMSNLKILENATNMNNEKYLESFVMKKHFCETLEWRGETAKLVELLVSTTEAMEYDLKNLMEWHKELDKEVKDTCAKVKDVDDRVQFCTDTLCREEMTLTKLVDIVDRLKHRKRSEIYPLREAYEKMNTSMNLTCTLIATKLLPLDKLLSSLQELREDLLARKVFQYNVNQRLDTCDKDLASVQSKLDQHDLNIRDSTRTSQINDQFSRQSVRECKQSLAQLENQLAKLGKDNSERSKQMSQVNQRLDTCEQSMTNFKATLELHARSLPTVSRLSQQNGELKRQVETTSVQLREDLRNVQEKLFTENVEKLKAMVIQHSSAGFSANLDGYKYFTEGETLKPYRSSWKESDSFSNVTGEFVAPRDGVYISVLTLKQSGDGRIRAHVCRLPNGESGLKSVCKASTGGNDESCTGVGYFRLRVGDKMIMRIISMDSTAKLTPYTSFNCCYLSA
ncbi:myosin-2 heavy chain non muscle [Biomphalaria pfeifferi]|uniref:Myosin-2 heavy chain non muscle n=1 Tax=Biomphalaria pfeifferi TaxID=112525 RepID=A0AAD8BME9_BIOPF|nr:myosin-2 heavy chain non muscle [Biomphalaria pfeifferi]